MQNPARLKFWSQMVTKSAGTLYAYSKPDSYTNLVIFIAPTTDFDAGDTIRLSSLGTLHAISGNGCRWILHEPLANDK